MPSHSSSSIVQHDHEVENLQNSLRNLYVNETHDDHLHATTDNESENPSSLQCIQRSMPLQLQMERYRAEIKVLRRRIGSTKSVFVLEKLSHAIETKYRTIMESNNEETVEQEQILEYEEGWFQTHRLPTFLVILRFLILDMPLTVLTLFFLLTFLSNHIYITFYHPLMNLLTWTPQKRSQSHTSCMRSCTSHDISTTTSQSLIVTPQTYTPTEAVAFIMTHGASVFPNLLRSSTITNMRNYVRNQNHQLSDKDQIPLISNHQRWSFPIGADDDPAVPPVLQDIAMHIHFQESLALLLGEDPAMVEFTAITAAYGADHQHWHRDNYDEACQMHYARSFVSMYSLFIPLQDTTRDMGATSACPGTHLCREEENLKDLCNDYDFQLDDTTTNTTENEPPIWKAGDGFLMHLNLYHRGPAHVDPQGLDRVMLIITVSSRPNNPSPSLTGSFGIESYSLDPRQISLGTSYSMKWDMWGMTMSDLQHVDKKRVTHGIWKVLRTFGIFKWRFRTKHNMMRKEKYAWVNELSWKELFHSHVTQLNTLFVTTRTPTSKKDLLFLLNNLFNHVKYYCNWNTLWHAVFFQSYNTPTKWGWDYFTVACSRIVNDQMGFRYHDLETTIDKIHATSYPSFSIGKLIKYFFGKMPRNAAENLEYNEDYRVWRHYMDECFRRLKVFVTIFYVFGILLYLFIGIAVGSGSMLRYSVKLHIALGLPCYLTLCCISHSPWGHDLLSSHLYDSPFPKSRRDVVTYTTILPSCMIQGPTTLATNHDVFIQTSLHAPQLLASHNDVYDYHPGNHAWNYLIGQSSGLYHQMVQYDYPVNVKRDMAYDIVKQIVSGEGTIRGRNGSTREDVDVDGYSRRNRFLRQTVEGDWTVIRPSEAIDLTFIELQSQSNPLLRVMKEDISKLVSICKHGRYRHTAMFGWHCIVLLKVLEEEMFPRVMMGDNGHGKQDRFIHPRKEDWMYTTMMKDNTEDPQLWSDNEKQTKKYRELGTHRNAFSVTSTVNLAQMNSILSSKSSSLLSITSHSNNPLPRLPFPMLGEYVEGLFDENSWFRGKVMYFNNDETTCAVQFDDGDFVSHQPMLHIRPFRPYIAGDTVVIFYNHEDGNSGPLEVEVLHVSGFGTMNLQVYEDGYIFKDIPVDRIHRVSQMKT